MFKYLTKICLFCVVIVLQGCTLDNTVNQNVITPITTVEDSCSLEERTKIQWGEESLASVVQRCIPNGWEDLFNKEETQKIITSISNDMDTFYNTNKEYIIFGPSPGLVFEALYATQPKDVKAIILGLDPRVPEATGLSFSIEGSSNLVASIQRMLLEARNQNVCVDVLDGNVSKWAYDSGVLLLNSALTFAFSECKSSDKKCSIPSGPIRQQSTWEPFINVLFDYINTNVKPSVVLAWGQESQLFSQKYIDTTKHTILTSGHPSPANKKDNFFCNNHFVCANEFLEKKQRSPVHWDLIDNCQKVEVPHTYTWSRHIDAKTGLRSVINKVCKPVDCSTYGKLMN